MTTAWFVDGAYAFTCWKQVGGGRVLDYTRLRDAIENDAQEEIGEAYYFSSDNDPPSNGQNNFHRAIAIPAPDGPGLRVKLYWLNVKKLYWPQALGGGPVLHPNDPTIQYELKTQKGVDVGLAFHLMRSFSKRKWDKLYLIAGDGDFHEVVQHLVEDEDVKLTILGTRQSISAELGPYGRPVYFDDIADKVAR